MYHPMNQPQTLPTKISGNQTCPDFISIARSKSPLPFESSGLRMHIWMATRSKVVGKPIGGEGVMMFHWHSHSFLIAPLLRSSLPTQETTDAIASNHNSAAFQPLSDSIVVAADCIVAALQRYPDKWPRGWHRESKPSPEAGKGNV